MSAGGSSSRCRGWVCSLWVWYIMIILTLLRVYDFKLWVKQMFGNGAELSLIFHKILGSLVSGCTPIILFWAGFPIIVFYGTSLLPAKKRLVCIPDYYPRFFVREKRDIILISYKSRSVVRVCPSVTFLVIASSPKPLDVATSKFPVA